MSLWDTMGPAMKTITVIGFIVFMILPPVAVGLQLLFGAN